MTDYTDLPDDTLKALRKQYQDIKRTLPLRHSSRRQNLSYDIRRAEDNIRLITLILNNRSLSRQRRKGPLKEFKF